MIVPQEVIEKVKVLAKAIDKRADEFHNSGALVYLLLKVPAVTERIRKDSILFSRLVLGFTPTTYQAKLMQDESKVGLARFCRQSGKTYAVGAKAIHAAVTNKNFFVLVIAPSLRQSMIVRDKLDEHLNKIPRKVRNSLFKSIQRQVIFLRNGSRIFFTPNSPENILGFTANLIIIDEFAVFPNDEYIYSQILTPMLNTTNGQLLACSTPRGKSGTFWRLHEESKRTNLLGKNYISTHHVTWKDALEAGIYNKDALERATLQYKSGMISEAQWQMEFEAEFWDDIDKFISIQTLMNSMKQDDPTNFYCSETGPRIQVGSAGIDLGKIEDHTVIIVFEEVGERLYLRIWKKFPLQTPYRDVLEYLKNLDKNHTISRKAIDRTNNEYVFEEARRIVSGVKGIAFTKARKAEMAGLLKHELIEGRIILPYDMHLAQEINLPSVKYSKRGEFDLLSPKSPDTFVAMMLAVWAAKRKKSAGVI